MSKEQKPNPYAVPAGGFTEDQLDSIFGKWVDTKLSDAAATVVWEEHLEHMQPIEMHNSLHVVENVYMLNGVRHSCIWSIGGPPNAIPLINVQMPRPRKTPAPAPVLAEPLVPFSPEHLDSLGQKLFNDNLALAVALTKVPELNGVTIDLAGIANVHTIGKFAREVIKLYERTLRPHIKG
jgi:hypothetical protein